MCPTPCNPRLLCPWDFPGQEYWHGLPFPSPGDLPDPGIEPTSPALAGGFFITEPPGKPSRGFTRNFNHETSRLSSQSSSDMAIWRSVLQLLCCLLLMGLSPWRREWQPTAVFLPRKSYGQRSLVGYSPWGGDCSLPGSTVHGIARSQTQLSNFTSL